MIYGNLMEFIGLGSLEVDMEIILEFMVLKEFHHYQILQDHGQIHLDGLILKITSGCLEDMEMTSC